MILKLQLLTEFLENWEKTPSKDKLCRINLLFEELGNSEDRDLLQSLSEISRKWDALKIIGLIKLNQEHLKNQELPPELSDYLQFEELFFKLRGLAFDLNERTKNIPDEVALHDSMDLSRYPIIVIEDCMKILEKNKSEDSNSLKRMLQNFSASYEVKKLNQAIDYLSAPIHLTKKLMDKNKMSLIENRNSYSKLLKDP